AEDGIRDGHVTGVQTCALPISSGGERNRPSRVDWPFSMTVASKFVNITSPFSNGAVRETRSGVWTRASDRIIDWPVSVMLNVGRSEERRVGKEGRARSRDKP